MHIYVFQNFLKVKIIHQLSRFTEKGPSIAEKVIRTIRKIFKKPIYLKGNADWLSELRSVIEQNNNSHHNSIKMAPIEASTNGKEITLNLQDNREKQKTKIQLGQLIRTADIERVFSKGDSTYWSHKLNTITQVNYYSVPSYWLNYLPESPKDTIKTYYYQQN